MEEQNSKKFIFVAIIIAIVILVIGFFLSRDTDTSFSLDSFAKCTAEKGLVMYGAAWCGHCAEQKKLFGSSFEFVKYVECPDNVELCTSKGINGYPTWIDALGKKYEGKQTLKLLAEISGCELPN